MRRQRRIFTFVSLWALATAVGSAFGLFFGTIRGFGLAHLFNPLGLAIVGTVLGASLGLAQWLVLRSYVSWARGWALVSMMGGLGGFLLGNMIPPLGWIQMLDPLGLALGGGIGIAQWVILRRVVPHAEWWVVISSVSYGITWSFGVGIFAGGGMLAFGLQSLIYGISTGLLLAWLLRSVWSETAQASAPSARGSGLIVVSVVAVVLLLLLLLPAGLVQQVLTPQPRVVPPQDQTAIRDVQIQINQVSLERTMLAATGVAARQNPFSEPADATAFAIQDDANRATYEALRSTANALHMTPVSEPVQPSNAAEATLVTRATEAASALQTSTVSTVTPAAP